MYKIHNKITVDNIFVLLLDIVLFLGYFYLNRYFTGIIAKKI